jgi:hypothetical protein
MMKIEINTNTPVVQLERAFRAAGIVLDPVPSADGVYHAYLGRPKCARCDREGAAWRDHELLCSEHWLEVLR